MLYDWSGSGGIGYRIWRFRPARGAFVVDSAASTMNEIEPVAGEPCVVQFTGSGTAKECRAGGGWRTVWVERSTKVSKSGRCLVTRSALRGRRRVVLRRRYEEYSCG
jgi:hypothetical protein